MTTTPAAAISRLHHAAATCECMASHCTHVAPGDPLAMMLAQMLADMGEEIAAAADTIETTLSTIPSPTALHSVAGFLRDSGTRIADLIDPYPTLLHRVRRAWHRASRKRKTQS